MPKNANAFVQEAKSVMDGVKYSLNRHKVGTMARRLAVESPDLLWRGRAFRFAVIRGMLLQENLLLGLNFGSQLLFAG